MSEENECASRSVVGKFLTTDPRRGLEREIEKLLDAKDRRYEELDSKYLAIQKQMYSSSVKPCEVHSDFAQGCFSCIYREAIKVKGLESELQKAQSALAWADEELSRLKSGKESQMVERISSLEKALAEQKEIKRRYQSRLGEECKRNMDLSRQIEGLRSGLQRIADCKEFTHDVQGNFVRKVWFVEEAKRLLKALAEPSESKCRHDKGLNWIKPFSHGGVNGGELIYPKHLHISCPHCPSEPSGEKKCKHKVVYNGVCSFCKKPIYTDLGFSYDTERDSFFFNKVKPTPPQEEKKS